MACAEVSREIGGKTPNASHVSIIIFFGAPPKESAEALDI